ncbi:MAG: hypothetical protein Q9201_006401, partial [Fulgogasparrea decipioides]
MSSDPAGKRPGEPQQGPPSKRATRSSDYGQLKKDLQPLEPLEPYSFQEQVDAMAPSDVLELPNFGSNLYAQDLFAIFAEQPSSNPRLTSMHEAWFRCRRPSIEELWASRHVAGASYQRTRQFQALRKVCTLQKLLELATEGHLVQQLRVLLLDHIMLMRILYPQSDDTPFLHFPDHEDRFYELVQTLSAAPSMAMAVAGVTADPIATTAGANASSVAPDVRIRIEGLRVDPGSITPLDRISGNVKAKHMIRQEIFIATRAQHMVEGFGSSGILLHGPSGTGKSLLALASATYSGKFKVYHARSSDLIVKRQGSSEQNIAALFAIAAGNGPAAIVIDDIEGLCMSRRSDSTDNSNRHRIANELLACMTKYHNVVVIGTTNLPWDLDPAFGRRFDSKVHVGLPTKSELYDLIRLRLVGLNHGLTSPDIWNLAQDCDGFTGDAMVKTINAAMKGLVLEWEFATHCRQVMVNDQQKFYPCDANQSGAIARTYDDFEREGSTDMVTTRKLNNQMLRMPAKDFGVQVPVSEREDREHR